jgi:hypothetical protein
VLVGDSVWDAYASAKAGPACIGVECGGTTAAELTLPVRWPSTRARRLCWPPSTTPPSARYPPMATRRRGDHDGGVRIQASASVSTARADDHGSNAPTAQDGPAKLSALDKQTWFGVLKRTFKQVGEDNLTTWAAALTYYGILSIFPGLLVLIAALRLTGQANKQKVLKNVTDIAPGPARSILTSALQNLQQGQISTAGLVALIGLLAALWSSSGYVGSFMQASVSIYDVPEGRPIWKKLPIRLGLPSRPASSSASPRSWWYSPAALPVASEISSVSVQRGNGLGNRKVASAGGPDQPAVRLAVLGRTERQARWFPLDQPREHARRCPVDRGVCGVRVGTSRTSPRTTRPTAVSPPSSCS